MPEFIIDNHEINFTRQAMNAAHQAYPREFAEWNLALFQKGKPVLPGVTVREIAPVGMTEGDKRAERAGADHSEGTPDGAGFDSQRSTKPAPQPVDAGGEWPKWSGNDAHVARYDTPHRGHIFTPKGRGYPEQLGVFPGSGIGDRNPITPTQAAAWLRANGHAKVADELEGDGACVLEGATAWEWVSPTNPNIAMFIVNLPDGRVYHKDKRVGSWVPAESQYRGGEGDTRLEGPAAKEALASLARWMEEGGGK